MEGVCSALPVSVMGGDTIVTFKRRLNGHMDMHLDMQGMEGYGPCVGR